MIKIDSVSKSYGKKNVLNEVNLCIQEGSIQGLVGSNGAGKTTLFNCIYRLCSYDGNICYNKDLKIGYMPSEGFFYESIKGMEYLEFALVARKQPIIGLNIERLNALFELPLNKYASEYSTGMQKRLMLMSILLQKNDFYIVDEPFNGLDLSSCIMLVQIVKKLKKEGKTVLISSHILTSLTDICDTIAYLHNGYIYKTYKPSEYNLIEKDILSTNLTEQLKEIENLEL